MQDENSGTLSGLLPLAQATVSTTVHIIATDARRKRAEKSLPLTILRSASKTAEHAERPDSSIAEDEDATTLLDAANGASDQPQEHSPVSFEARSLFKEINHAIALRYSVEGLPEGSGLVLDEATGLLSGLPSSADRRAPQPMVLVFVARDRRGRRATQSLALDLRTAHTYEDSSQETEAQANLVSSQQSTPRAVMVKQDQSEHNFASDVDTHTVAIGKPFFLKVLPPVELLGHLQKFGVKLIASQVFELMCLCLLPQLDKLMRLTTLSWFCLLILPSIPSFSAA